jgi:phosphotransferase system enzyme I (PtsI)
MQHARPLIQDDDLLIVDGTRGVLIVDPDPGVLQEYRLRKAELELERSKLKRLIGARARTLDGEDVELHANIELPQDTDRAREVGADGVGLFRTEFLFMNRDELPGEDEQFEAYRAVVKAMGGKPVTIRTLDIGADKEARALRTRAGNRFRRTRRWACARSASAWPSRSCSWCSCAPSCAPRTTARCGC